VLETEVIVEPTVESGTPDAPVGPTLRVEYAPFDPRLSTEEFEMYVVPLTKHLSRLRLPAAVPPVPTFPLTQVVVAFRLSLMVTLCVPKIA